MFERIRQRLIEERGEIEFHRRLMTDVLIPYYIAAVPTYVLLVDEAAFAREFGPLWVLKTSHDKDCVGRLLYFLTKDVIGGSFLIPTLIVVVGVELMRHHWHIDEHMGESSSF